MKMVTTIVTMTVRLGSDVPVPKNLPQNSVIFQHLLEGEKVDLLGTESLFDALLAHNATTFAVGTKTGLGEDERANPSGSRLRICRRRTE